MRSIDVRNNIRKISGNLAALFVGILLSVVLLEIACLIMVRSEYIDARIPTYSLERNAKTFWGDINKDFGVWHYPEIEFRHTRSCFDVVYRSNSYGARDIEREYRSENPRIVVLGDSFLEGWGVREDRRMPNVLEARTGLEHLNFGTAGNFGPTQEYLLYKTLASRFDHTAVILGILPENDFQDDLPHDGRYTPYWEGEYPHYTLRYSQGFLRKSKWSEKKDLEGFDFTRFMRNFTYFQNVYETMEARINLWQKIRKQEQRENLRGSKFCDYTEAELDRLWYSIEMIAQEAGERPLIVFTIPRFTDLLVYDKQRKSRLGLALESLSQDLGSVYFLDLLPIMHRRYQDRWAELYFSCDRHWSETGHKVASDIFYEMHKALIYNPM